jgi:hypothetical protein
MTGVVISARVITFVTNVVNAVLRRLGLPRDDDGRPMA